MKIIDFIWPFGTISHLRRENAGMLYRYERMRDELNHTKVSYEVKLNRLRAELARAEDLLRRAHFRNPKTGRLMAKGKLP